MSSLNTSNYLIPSTLQIDISIFDNMRQYPSSNCNDYKSCIAINRLLCALRYYQSLKLHSNQNDQEIFTNFTKQVYKHPLLIEDLHHFIKKHDKQLNNIIHYVINTGLCKECDIDSCKYSSRHYRVKTDDNNSDNIDPNLRLYGDSLDSFHFYLFHLYQVGLRCIEYKEDDYVDDRKEDKLYDAQFARIQKVISSTRGSSDRFKRVSPGNKFNLKVEETIQNEEDQKEYQVNECDITYLDTLWQHLYEMKVPEDVILRLVNYSKEKEYETESMDMDLQIDGGNIEQYMVDHQECFQAVVGFFNKSRGIFICHISIHFFSCKQ